MSQHIYTHKKVTVLAGWDRPMRHIFLTVLDSDSEDTLYSSLFDSKANDSQDGEHFKSVLNEMNIPCPEGFWEQIKFDKLNNVGNVHTTWELQ